MPRYDYQCLLCQHRFEVLHSMEDSSKHPCPLCHGLTQKVTDVGKIRILTTATPEPEQQAPLEKDHTCHPGCAHAYVDEIIKADLQATQHPHAPE
jgi:putative FmdB family regulatory protein